MEVVVIAALLLLVACAPRAPVPDAVECLDQPIDHPSDESLQQVIENTLYQVPGVAVVVDDPGVGYWAGAGGFADLAHERPLDPCHLVRVASVTKTFTAVAVMRLAERGEIALDDRVADHLDPRDVRHVDGAEDATWRGLLQHTAGIPDYPASIAFTLDTFQRPTDLRSRRRLIHYAWPMRSPEGWAYSNTGYELLGEALEDVTGQPLSEVLQDEVFAPAGLERTWFADIDDVPEPIARGYSDVLYRGGTLTDVTEWDRSGERAATDVITSMVDLVRFARALFDGELVSQASLFDMTQWVEAREEEAGLGLFRTEFDNAVWIGHTGGIPGFSTRFGRIEGSDTVIAYVATGTGEGVSIAMEDFDYALFAAVRPP